MMYQFGQRASVISLWQTLMEACQALILQLNSVIWCQCHLLAFVQRCVCHWTVPPHPHIGSLFVCVCVFVGTFGGLEETYSMFKGNIFLAGENIFAKVCQHLAFGGLETTLSKFEHRLLPTTDAKNPRTETKIWIFAKIWIKYVIFVITAFWGS